MENQNNRINLDGIWQFKQYPEDARRMRDLDTGNWKNCSIPNSIYTALIETGDIEQAEIIKNPENFLHNSKKAWIFQKHFDCTDELLKSDKIELICDGLDCFCQIWLNEKLIARTDNMFIQWRFDVKDYLKKTNNRLLIKCEPVLQRAKQLMNRFGTLSVDQCSFAQRNYARKAQCQFGWDWAPPLPGCGIWQSVRIEAANGAKINHTLVRTLQTDKNSADIKIAVAIEKIKKGQDIVCKLTVVSPQGKEIAKTQLDYNDNNNCISTVIKIISPQLWFPAGYGSQPIYELKAELLCNNELADCRQQKFGIRIAELRQQKDKIGSSFEFNINHTPVYARGAAWVPASLFIGSVKPADYEQLLTAAKNANINMLRVWGGGLYETDCFYNICDRLGIMVWQDFAFACSYYPDRTWFGDMIKTEASYNIKRLRNHPSLVLWCGSNEIFWMHKSGWLGKGKKLYGKDIYEKILPQILAELDADRDYIKSTPLDRGRDVNSPANGTVHQWDVWSNVRPSDDYLSSVPRFVGEFGAQGLPVKKTLKTFVQNKSMTSPDFEKHDYQPNGMQKMHYYINELFCRPKDINQLIYFSQLTQARMIRKNAEHLRLNSNINSGLLYWQFNESCAAIGWSAIDYFKRPKALYYYTKRCYGAVIIAIKAEDNGNNIVKHRKTTALTGAVINHSSTTATGMLTCRLYDMQLNVIDEFCKPVSASPAENAPFTLPKSFIPKENLNEYFVFAKFENNNKIITENSFFFVPDKYVKWQKPDIKTECVKIAENTYRIKCKADCAVKDVYLDFDLPQEVELDDNFFDLLDGKEKIITAETNGNIEKANISIMTVNDILG